MEGGAAGNRGGGSDGRGQGRREGQGKRKMDVSLSGGPGGLGRMSVRP